MKIAILTLIAGLGIGAAAAHYGDAAIVADVLQSDDLSITRNVEQANALLDIYEQGKGKEQISRDDRGVETDIAPMRLGERVASWMDDGFTELGGIVK